MAFSLAVARSVASTAVVPTADARTENGTEMIWVLEASPTRPQTVIGFDNGISPVIDVTFEAPSWGVSASASPSALVVSNQVAYTFAVTNLWGVPARH